MYTWVLKAFIKYELQVKNDFLWKNARFETQKMFNEDASNLYMCSNGNDWKEFLLAWYEV